MREREPLVVKSLLCSDLEMCTASRVLVTVQWYCSVRSPLLYLQTPQLQFDSSLDLDVLLDVLPSPAVHHYPSLGSKPVSQCQQSAGWYLLVIRIGWNIHF